MSTNLHLPTIVQGQINGRRLGKMHLILSYQLVVFAFINILSIQGCDDEDKVGTVDTRPIAKSKRDGIIEGQQYQLFSTKLETTKPLLVYAGCMFDIKAKSNHIKISTIGFNTYTNKPLDVTLFMKDGGYRGAEYVLSEWMHVANITVTGQGMGNVTYIPEGSFEPILIEKRQRISFYLTTPNGPLLITSRGSKERSDIDIPSDDLILYEGVGKRLPIDTGRVIAPRVFNGVIGYNTVLRRQPAPISGASLSGLRVANETFTPNDDDQIKDSSECIYIMKFDGLSEVLEQPHTLLSVVLRLFAIEKSYFGGNIYVINNESENLAINETNINSSIKDTGIFAGKIDRIYSENYYEIDIVHALTSDNIPSSLIVAVTSTNNDDNLYYTLGGIRKRRRPSLTVSFAYDAGINKGLAELFGTDSPTYAPALLDWKDYNEPANPIETYFNYNPNSDYGPSSWQNIKSDSYYDQYQYLATNSNNQCTGKYQSPRDVCQPSYNCTEWHEIRRRIGQYGLDSRNEDIFRPTPHIMHNKLRLSYKEPLTYDNSPVPPRADFAMNPGDDLLDLLQIDLKVKSEHRLCGKQYDAEMQLYYIHKRGNLEAIALLIEIDGHDNDHFQQLLDFFQAKFDDDKRSCQRKTLRARALLSSHIFKTIYQGIRRFLAIETAQFSWDPLKPWSMYRSIHFWAYYGSLTEPPCTQYVKWRIIDVPFHISLRQYIQLKKLMFDHVDPQSCQKTSTHFQESNARPIQTTGNSTVYRCSRSNYVSDMERETSGKWEGYDDPQDWTGVDMFPYITPEFIGK